MFEKAITNSRGEKISIEKYDNVYFEGFVNGYAIVEKNGRQGLINEDGKEICPVKYEQVWPFRKTNTPNGRRVLNATRVCLNGLYGLIDRNGKEICPIKYKRIDDFDGDQKAYAESGKDILYLDENGKEHIIYKLRGTL